MKRLVLLLCIVSLQLPRAFALDPEEVNKVADNARTKRDYLAEDQKTLKEMMDQQQKVVNDVPAEQKEQKEQEQAKLDEIKNFYSVTGTKIASLSDYIDKVSNKETITQDDLDKAEKNIQIAQELIKTNAVLKDEYLSSAPTQEQIGQEAQAQIEKLSLWNTFKLNIQSVFTQTKAALASFFGNKEAVMAAHKDLLDIYDQLKDYSSKAKSAGQLAGWYKDIGNFSDAIKMQATQLDILNDPNVSQFEKYSTLSDIMADLLSLRTRIDAELFRSTPQDEETMLNIESQINDFLGNLGLKINKISAYEVLGLDSTATIDEIKKTVLQLIRGFGRSETSATDEIFREIENAGKELLGSDINNPNPEIKKIYDESPIVQQGFELKAMTDQEQADFAQQKAQKASQTQTGILGPES